MKKHYQNLLDKYDAYRESGLRLFTVTLSTFITSRSYAQSDRMRHMWDAHFIPRVQRSIPYKFKEKIDHDFIIEASPDGHYHYHGLLAMTPEAASSIWKEGALKRQLTRDLDSFRHAGELRPFRINKHLIEPVREGELVAWIKYITKNSWEMQ